MKLKFQTIAEKTAKNFRGLLYFAAPGILTAWHKRCRRWPVILTKQWRLCTTTTKCGVSTAFYQSSTTFPSLTRRHPETAIHSDQACMSAAPLHRTPFGHIW